MLTSLKSRLTIIADVDVPDVTLDDQHINVIPVVDESKLNALQASVTADIDVPDIRAVVYFDLPEITLDDQYITVIPVVDESKLSALQVPVIGDIDVPEVRAVVYFDLPEITLDDQYINVIPVVDESKLSALQVPVIADYDIPDKYVSQAPVYPTVEAAESLDSETLYSTIVRAITATQDEYSETVLSPDDVVTAVYAAANQVVRAIESTRGGVNMGELSRRVTSEQVRRARATGTNL